MHTKTLVNKEKGKRGRPPKKKEENTLASAASEQKNPATVAKPEDGVRKDAPQENCFILCNGKPVKNIKELADLMDELEDHVFNHHVNSEKNDFSVWVKDIFKDVELAEKLAGVNDKKHMQLVLYKHITHKLW